MDWDLRGTATMSTRTHLTMTSIAPRHTTRHGPGAAIAGRTAPGCRGARERLVIEQRAGIASSMNTG
jgi:hypothetical protein